MLHFKQLLNKKALAVGAVVLSLVVSPFAMVGPTFALSERQKIFSDAAKEFNIPEEVLLATSYHKSRWQDHDGKPSRDGGYGPMHLRDIESASKFNGRGDEVVRDRSVKVDETMQTLQTAAQLIGESEQTVKQDYRHNIRGGAALLAKFATEVNDGELPTTTEDWYGAVARFSNATDLGLAESFADDVYNTIQQGAQESKNGHSITLPAKSLIKKSKEQLDKLSQLKERFQQRVKKQSDAECPRSLDCKYVPAHFAQNDPDNPYDYGNYDEAERPNDLAIKYIVIHNMEGTYEDSIDWFLNPASYVSSHYLIRSSDGEVTQMVKNKDVAWHAGNWYMNTHSIGIEHEGFAAEGAVWYTEEMYRSSAKLVQYLAKKHGIPLDRNHIVGHDEYMGINPTATARMHHDPGPYWDWEHYMELIGGSNKAHQWGGKNAVTIAPRFKHNQQDVTQCLDDVCEALPTQSANFLYLHTEPHADAPLLTDAALHPDGAPGTTEIADTSAKATHGRQYIKAGQQGEWTAIWFNGQKGWFHNPNGVHTKSIKTKAVTPAAGQTEIPIYGRPVPEASAFPSEITPLTPTPLQHTIPAGQRYVISAKPINDYYHVWTFDHSDPGDGTIVVGNEKYYAISFGHRQAFVKASDVEIVQ